MSQIKATTASGITETADTTGTLELFGNAGTGITIDATTGEASMPIQGTTSRRYITKSTVARSIQSLVRITGIADNVATAIFTVTTTNETGNTDGGVYVCKLDCIIGHTGLSSGSTNAGKAWSGQFTRTMESTGTGVNTAVENIFSGASAPTASGTRDISTITASVTETSEYIQTFNLQVDLTGSSISTASVVGVVTVTYFGFITDPVIA